MAAEASGSGKHGIDAVTAFLDSNGASYEVVEHEQTQTAREDARASGVSPSDEAKSVLLRVGDGYCLAVIPASEQLDLHKVRELVGGPARLATEREMASDYQQFEVGAIPPLGPMLSARGILDRRLLDHDVIVGCGGDHRHSIRIDPNALVEVASPTLADICQD
jgi:Ala-tRNA(Pro) deacylase